MAKKSTAALRRWILTKAALPEGLILDKWFPSPRTVKQVKHLLHHEKLIKITEDINDKQYRFNLTEKGEAKCRELK